MTKGMGLSSNKSNKPEKNKEQEEKRVSTVHPKRQTERKARQKASVKPAKKKAPIKKPKAVKKTRQAKKTKLLVAIPILIVSLIILYLGFNYKTLLQGTNEPSTEESNGPTESMDDEAIISDPENNVPVEEEYASKNHELALRSASDHITHNPYSRDGLYQQLLSEGYSPKAVEFAVTEIDEKSTVDWKENAIISSERFIAYAAPEISEKLLKEQLVYEGFNAEQISHALKNVDKSTFKADDEISETYLPDNPEIELSDDELKELDEKENKDEKETSEE